MMESDVALTALERIAAAQERQALAAEISVLLMTTAGIDALQFTNPGVYKSIVVTLSAVAESMKVHTT